MDEADRENGSDEARPSTGKRLFSGVVGAAVLGLILWGALHVMIVPVHPDQAAPSGHYGGPCVACHIVSSDARIIEGR
jgi:hypothetical protein